MSAKDAHLYGQRPASRAKAKDISSSSTLAFSSQLSSLIKSASSSSKAPAPGRGRAKREDIFASHNRNVKKRALKDLEDADMAQKHRGRTADEKADDGEQWKRTKRRLEEKARLYNALKRGDVEDLDDKYGVDFDSKWAEQQAKGEQEADSSSDSEASEEELFDYVDEFGRTRKGTRGQIAREERRRRMQAADEPDRFTARPSAPDGIILGDTIQTHAFNPDETIAQQMADLAAKRDKDLTPPPDQHFDGKAEARQRGTAFMHFSKHEAERKEQMANLEQERQETEKARAARKQHLEDRAQLIAEKKQKIKDKQAKGRADRFLNDLERELTKNGDAE